MYYLIYSLTVEHTETIDIFGTHDYRRDEELAEKYKILETNRLTIPHNGKEAMAFGYKYNNFADYRHGIRRHC